MWANLSLGCSKRVAYHIHESECVAIGAGMKVHYPDIKEEYKFNIMRSSSSTRLGMGE